MRGGRHLVVLAAVATGLAACGGGSSSTAPASRGSTGEVTVTLMPTAVAPATQLTSAANIVRARLSGLGVSVRVVVAHGVLRVSVPSNERVAVYAAEFPGVLSFREIRAQAGGAVTGSDTPSPVGPDGTGPTVTGLNAPSSEPDQTAPSAAALAQFAALDCSIAQNGRPTPVDEDPHHFVAACDQTGQTKYLLTPADLTGAQVASATAAEGQSSVGSVWEVDLTFQDSAVAQVEAVSRRLYGNNKQQLAITLDGLVLSAPTTNGILGKNITIAGGRPPFSRGEAQGLAGVVSSGALPLALTVSE